MIEMYFDCSLTLIGLGTVSLGSYSSMELGSYHSRYKIIANVSYIANDSMTYLLQFMIQWLNRSSIPSIEAIFANFMKDLAWFFCRLVQSINI